MIPDFFRPSRAVSWFLGAALCLALVPAPASAQNRTNRRPIDFDTLVFRVDPIVVTATRGPREASKIPQPVSVLQRRDLVQSIPNTVTDLFRTLPGVDVTGVGINQGRPQIRGQRGTRILLLEDGIRLNNFRRQQDFGEIPAVVDVTGVERVEIIRGPASVLYGSDAIGGVVNIITRTAQAEGLHGSAAVRYGDVEGQRKGTARVYGRFGDMTLRAGGTYRTADAYSAPAGSFGDITLDGETQVLNSGVEDRSMDFRLGWEPAGSHSVWGKFESYQADDAGFGSVNTDLYDPGAPQLDITYPMQRWNKVTAGYVGQDLGTGLADRVALTAYGLDNERDLHFAFGLAMGPTARMDILNKNNTDVRTYGLRAEARKLATPGLLLTYGVDMIRERAIGTDNNSTVIVGFGPFPIEDVSDRPQLPEARFTTLGAFLQGEVEVSDRFSFVAGGRYQTANGQTFETVGLEDQDPISITDGTFVAAVNSIVDLGGGTALVASVGRAFRSPNLIERFFDGAIPEGSGWQVRNPELKAETSFNVDIGLRYTSQRLRLEGFYYRNKIYDGIRIEPLDTEYNGLDAYRNTNVEQLLYRGVELTGEVGMGAGFSFGSNFTWMEAKDVLDEQNPIGESFNSKITNTLRYTDPADRFWTAYELRHNGERKDLELGDNPIGDALPAFTVMNLRAGIRVFSTGSQTHRLNLALTNLTNQLYAEFSNATFFRPEPKRNITLMWDVSF